MKYLALALLLFALPAVSYAACYRKSFSFGMTRCKDDVDGTWHKIGSTWRNSHCMDCSCHQCCSAYSTPVQYPDDCVSVFDQKACKYTVHKKNNPAELCPIWAMVMK